MYSGADFIGGPAMPSIEGQGRAIRRQIAASSVFWSLKADTTRVPCTPRRLRQRYPRTSLREAVADAILREGSPGLERASICGTGYAVEYDYARARPVGTTLEHQACVRLYLPGKSTVRPVRRGADKGLIAGANAALTLLGRETTLLDSHEAYIGVLVDDW